MPIYTMYYAIRMGMIAVLFLFVFNAIGDVFLKTNVFVKVLGRLAYKVFVGVVGLFALWLMTMDRDMWLPFLSAAAIPKTVLAEDSHITGDTVKKVRVNVGAKNTKVFYWHSYNTGAKVLDVKSAYGDYANARVTTSDGHGFAEFVLTQIPSAYTVPTGQTIPSHIHYRYMESDTMASAVKTYYL